MAKVGIYAVSTEAMGNPYLNRSLEITGMTAGEVIPNGGLVVCDITSVAPPTIYSTTSPNRENAKRWEAANASTLAFYVLNIVGVPTAVDNNGQVFRVGSDVTNLSYPIGTTVRGQKLKEDDIFYLYDGLIEGTAPTLGQFLVPTDSSFKYTTAATLPASGLSMVVDAIEGLTAGLSGSELKYRCRVVAVK